MRWAAGVAGLVFGFAVILVALRVNPGLAAHREADPTEILIHGYAAAMISTLIG